jgi:hypothetical protein
MASLDDAKALARQFGTTLRSFAQTAAPVIRHALTLAGRGLQAFWRVAKPALRTGLELLLAIIIVFEEWGWRPLAEALGRLARWRPWAILESLIIRLPPYAALVVFVLPSALLLPLKFLALLLITKGQLVLAGLLFATAKIVATALVARLFILTQPALMQIGWFAWGYDTFMPWKDALVAHVRTTWVWRAGRVWKERGRRAVQSQWRAMRPTMVALRARVTLEWQRLRVLGRAALRAARTRFSSHQS